MFCNLIIVTTFFFFILVGLAIYLCRKKSSPQLLIQLLLLLLHLYNVLLSCNKCYHHTITIVLITKKGLESNGVNRKIHHFTFVHISALPLNIYFHTLYPKFCYCILSQLYLVNIYNLCSNTYKHLIWLAMSYHT